MTAIPASFVRCQTMADSTLRLVLDVDPPHAREAFALFAEFGTPLAIARLKTPTEQAKPKPEDKPKGGNAAQWLGQMCKEDDFADWLLVNFPDQYKTAWLDSSTTNIHEASAKAVRSICGVKSRADINDTNPEAVKKFHALRVLWNQSRKA